LSPAQNTGAGAAQGVIAKKRTSMLSSVNEIDDEYKQADVDTTPEKVVGKL